MSANLAKPVDYWTLDASGLTSVASNWSAGIPARGADVVVAPTAAGVVVTFDALGYTLDALTLQNVTGVLQGGNLAVQAGVTFEAATLLGPHAMVFGGQSQATGLTLGGGATLYNKGVVTQSGGAVEIGVSKTSTALIDNMAGANWIDADNSPVSKGAGFGDWFLNSGTFTDSAASGVTTISASFKSNGTVAVAAGETLSFSGRFSSTGTINVAAKGVVVFAGAGAQTDVSGSVTGGGTVEYGPYSMATLGALTVTATNQNNLGIVNQTGALTLGGVQTLENLGQWNLVGDVSIGLGAGANAANEIVSTQAGLLAKTSGTGRSVVAADVNLAGGVNVATGTLEFTGALNGFSGPISGAGTFQISAGVAQFEPNASTTETISVANFLLSGGATEIIGSVTDAGAFEGDAGATLSLGPTNLGFSTYGYLTLTGSADFDGLDITGTGQLTVQATGSATVSGLTLGGSSILFDRGVVTQTGGNLTIGDSVAAGAASLTLNYGGVWNIIDASGINAGAGQGNSITLGDTASAATALLEKTGAGLSVVSPIVRNNASNVVTSAGVQYEGLEVSAGTLDFHNAVGGTGSDNIAGAGTLEFDAAVTAGQTTSFFGVGGTLELNDPNAFKGAIVGFDSTGGADTLLIGGGTVKFTGATETATAATLAFSYLGGGNFTVTLNGDYQGSTFAAQALSNGQVAITA